MMYFQVDMKQQSNNREQRKYIGGIDLERIGSSHYGKNKQTIVPTQPYI